MITRTRLSVAAMLVLAGLSVVYIFNCGLSVGSFNQRHASVTVPDTNGILVGSRVLLRGIQIGRVTAINPSDSGVDLSLNYDDDVRVPVASNYRIENLSALGEAYVSVVPSTSKGPYLADGAHVKGSSVDTISTFRDLSEQLTDTLKQVDPAALQRIFAELNSGLPDGEETLTPLNRLGQLLTSEFTRESDSLVTLLSTIQPLLMRTAAIPGQLAATTPNLYRFGDNMADFAELAWKVIVPEEPVNFYLAIRDGASPVFVQLQKFLDRNSSNLGRIGTNLLPGARSAAAAMRTVDIGRVLDSFLRATNTRDGALEVHVPVGGR